MRSYENRRGDILVSFDENGLSRNVELNVLNVQAGERRSEWREVYVSSKRYRTKQCVHVFLVVQEADLHFLKISKKYITGFLFKRLVVGMQKKVR